MATGTTVGTLLQRYRNAAGITQERLAEQAGLSARGISDIERGLKQRPHPRTLRQLADALELTPYDRKGFLDSARPGHATGQTPPPPISRPPTGGFLGALPVGPLVERQSELERIALAAQAVHAGSGRLVLISGEPGVGKTRLMQDVMLLLEEGDFTVAVGRCYTTDEEIPYYPFLEVLTSLYGTAAERVRADVPRRWPHLAHLLPDSPQVQLTTPAQANEHQHMLRAITGFIRAIAGSAPVAILLDDLHWADRSSLQLLLHLARFTRDSKVLLVGAFRDADVVQPHPLGDMLLELHRDGLEERLHLAHLTPAGIRQIIEVSCGSVRNPEALAHFIHARSDGNAFFTQELLHAIVDRGTVPSTDETNIELPDDLEVPDTVRAVILQRLAQLPPTSQEVLYEASVLGQAFSFEAVAEMSGQVEDAVELALEDARVRGLVRTTGRDSYAFNHALTWQALYGEVSPRRKRRLHRAAAHALARTGSGPIAAEVLWHLLEAGDTHGAIPVALLAGDQAAATFARDQAVRHYDMALTLARNAGARHEEAAALEKLAATLVALGRYQEAEESAERSISLFRSVDDTDGKIRATTWLSQALEAQGRSQDALAVCRQLLESLGGPATSPDLAFLYLQMTELQGRAGEFEEAAAAAEVAAEMARALGDDRLRAQVDLNRSWALGCLRRYAEARAILQRWLQLAEERNDLLSLFRLLVPLGQVSVYQGDLQASKQYRERLVEVARRIGNPANTARALSYLGNSRFVLGDWHGARTNMEEALEIAQSLDSAGVLVVPLFDLGHLTVCEGDWDTGEAYLHQSLDMVHRSGDLTFTLIVHLFLANLELLRGRPEAVIERLLPLLAHRGSAETAVGPLLPALAQAYLAMGDVDRADSVASDALRLVTEAGNRLDLISALLSKAGVLEKRGRLDEARAKIEEALQLAREMSFPAGEALALYRWGMLESHAGNVDPARSCLRGSRAIYRRLGACKDVEQIDQALDRLLSLDYSTTQVD